MNGDCTAPDTCTCRQGFTMTKDSTGMATGLCVAHCEHGCVNGDCLQSGRCTCHQGHVKDPQVRAEDTPGHAGHGGAGHLRQLGVHLDVPQDATGSRCIPFCPGGCGKGRCVAPGQCSCGTGFVVEAGKGCKPVCTEECVNANCTAPNECTCNQGFRKDPTSLAGNK